jgi:Zn-finger domain-containing protein
MAMAFMCFSKKAVSACELQRQLKHSRYDTVWSLMHRIRNIMGNREALNYLPDAGELDKKLQIIATVERIRFKTRKGRSKEFREVSNQRIHISVISRTRRRITIRH